MWIHYLGIRSLVFQMASDKFSQKNKAILLVFKSIFFVSIGCRKRFALKTDKFDTTQNANS